MPTLRRIGPYRFFIVLYDCEERKHVHVTGGGSGAAKLWLEPSLEVAAFGGYTRREMDRIVSVARRSFFSLTRRWIEECEGFAG